MHALRGYAASVCSCLNCCCVLVADSGGDVCVVVASTKEVKVGAVRQAFQEILGHATVYGQVRSNPEASYYKLLFGSSPKKSK